MSYVSSNTFASLVSIEMVSKPTCVGVIIKHSNVMTVALVYKKIGFVIRNALAAFCCSLV